MQQCSSQVQESASATAQLNLLAGRYRFADLLIAEAPGQLRLGSGGLHFLSVP
jgi:hypothetical protein